MCCWLSPDVFVPLQVIDAAQSIEAVHSDIKTHSISAINAAEIQPIGELWKWTWTNHSHLFFFKWQINESAEDSILVLICDRKDSVKDLTTALVSWSETRTQTV